MYYRKEMTAAHYDSDVSDLLKVSAMIRYMQETSGEQLDGLGQTARELREQGLVFILSKTSIKVHRNPVCGERLSIGTAAIPPKGVRFVREYVIDSMEGERLVSCYTFWVLVDAENHKILRPASYPYTIPWEEPSLTGVLSEGDIPKDLPQETPVWSVERRMRYSHLDRNWHVNNSMYADFVCDALPFDELTARGVSTMALSFQKEAKQGDLLSIQSALAGPLAYKITGKNGEDVCFEAYVELGDPARP